MTGSKTGRVWAGCLLAIIVQAAAPASAAAREVTGGCGVSEAAAPVSSARQDVAAARTGRIPGLGGISAAIGWDNRKQVRLSGRDFEVTRTLTPLNEVEISISGRGEDPLVIRFGGPDGLSVTRHGQAFRGALGADAMRNALGGRAVAAFREQIGHYERRLMAGNTAKRVDDPHAYGFLLTGALVASMSGDTTAVGRARDLMMRRVRGNVRSVRFEFNDCVTDYQLYLLKIDTQRTQCLEAANGRDSWYARAADRLGCEAEFIFQALAGEGQFISCTALGSIVS